MENTNKIKVYFKHLNIKNLLFKKNVSVKPDIWRYIISSSKFFKAFMASTFDGANICVALMIVAVYEVNH